MYYTYMLRCQDGSLYTGITTDLNRRFREHSGAGAVGAKYTKNSCPYYHRGCVEQQRPQPGFFFRVPDKTSQEAEKKELLINNPDLLGQILGDKIDSQEYVSIVYKF